ncbi:hypothetical protein FLGE108171_15990 [Flavobacterium gelidilacus]|uniref:hypothetical protein n=1 Tax=Flavobacterium gelidilacus TaxID=206041 RepID=UPI0004063F01|nr:hypothetical protein [Flavobacterium gelidilacus]
MKKILIFICFILTIVTYSQSKDQFRVDYDKISFFDSETKKWSEWKDGYNTFVINYNDNKDVAHFKANGEKVIYRRISDEIKEGYTPIGNEHYQIITALDEDGITFTFQLFDNKEIGLKIIYNNLMIQFSKI